LVGLAPRVGVGLGSADDAAAEGLPVAGAVAAVGVVLAWGVGFGVGVALGVGLGFWVGVGEAAACAPGATPGLSCPLPRFQENATDPPSGIFSPLAATVE
jgi:hypothetical protein